MARRHHHFTGPLNPHPSLIDDPRSRHRQAHPAAVIEAQQREIQALLLDNQRLAATHVALKQELAAADQELRHLSSTAATVKAENDSRVHEVYERSLQTEAELSSVDEQLAELARVRADIQKMTVNRKELTDKLREINEDLVLARSELQQFPAIEEEIKAMHKEIQRGSFAVEYEKKMHAHNLEQSQILEKHIVSMARDIETLHAELANAEKRARAAAAAAIPDPGFAIGYANPETGYGGTLYSNSYPIRQAQAVNDAIPQYGAGGVLQGPSGPYDVQRSNVHR